MKRDLELAYLGVEVPDPGSLSSFFGEVIGLVPGAPARDGAITWRNDFKAHRVIVQPGPPASASPASPLASSSPGQLSSPGSSASAR